MYKESREWNWQHWPQSATRCFFISWGEANQWISLVWSSQSFQPSLVPKLTDCKFTESYGFENVLTLDDLKNRYPGIVYRVRSSLLKVWRDVMDASRLLPVLRVLRFSWPEIAPQAPSKPRDLVQISSYKKLDAGYLGPKTPATHLAGASKQGIQRPLPTYFPFRQKQLGSLNEFISARLQPVETFGLLYSRHQKNESRNPRRQMCQHNFSARLTHWSAGFAIRCVHCLVRYIQEKQSKMARYWIVCKHASICFPNSHIYCVIWGIDMDGTGTLQTGPSQVVARDQEVFSRLGLESPLTFLNPQIFDVHVKVIFDFSGLCIRCLPCISQLLDGRWTASAFGVRPGRQQCSNVSLNLGLFRWNGWMDEFVLDMCLNLEDMTCRSSRVRWVPKFCTEFASWMLNPRQPSRPWSYQKFSMIYIYILHYIHTIMFNLKVC